MPYLCLIFERTDMVIYLFLKSHSAVPKYAYQGGQMLRLNIYKLCFQFCISPPMGNLLFFYSYMAVHGVC